MRIADWNKIPEDKKRKNMKNLNQNNGGCHAADVRETLWSLNKARAGQNTELFVYENGATINNVDILA
jgi:hypothetical protein